MRLPCPVQRAMAAAAPYPRSSGCAAPTQGKFRKNWVQPRVPWYLGEVDSGMLAHGDDWDNKPPNGSVLKVGRCWSG